MSRARQYNGAWPEIVAGVVIALVVGVGTLAAAGIVPSPGGGQDDDTARLSNGSSDVDLDLGPVPDPAAVEDCLLPGFAADASQVEVLYDQQQRTATGSSPVLVLRNRRGEVQLCDMYGADRPSTVPQPVATGAEPARFYSAGRTAWSCTGRAIDGLTMSRWLSVTDRVARAQLRFVVNGQRGDWFTSNNHNGFVHLQVWLGPLEEDAALRVEVRALDADGHAVRSTDLPGGTNPLTGCRGSDVTIG